MAELTEQLIQKLGLKDEPKISSKTTELLRLLELRSTNISASLNVYANVVLCIDLAASFLGIIYDQENAIKISGIRKTQYINNKRMLEKILDLNKQVGVKDICIKLGVNEVAKRATELMEMHKNVVESEASDVDITHPQYAAMAVYQACKIAQKRLPKQKILAFSHLRPSQWAQLEQRWDKIVVAYAKKNEKKTEIKEAGADGATNDGEPENTSKTTKRSKAPEIEDYEIWKRRMLTISHIALCNNGDKENIVKA